MKFKTTAEIKRAFLPILLLSILGILLGLLLPLFFVINPTPEYEDMLEATIQVESIDYISVYRGGGHYELKSADGELYNLSGDFQIDDLRTQISKGTEIQIKWYSKTWLFQRKLYIEEIKLQNEFLSVYSNDDRGALIFGIVAGCLCIAMGSGGIVLYYKWTHEEIDKLSRKHRK